MDEYSRRDTQESEPSTNFRNATLVHPKNNRAGEKEWLAAPWRNGADTAWMVENQIANAYRLREEARFVRKHDFESLYENTLKDLGTNADPNGRRWVVGVARPLRRQSPKTSHTTDTAAEIRYKAMTLFTQRHSDDPLACLDDSSMRRGVRRERFTTRWHLAGPSKFQVVLDIHDGGSIALAMTRGAGPGIDGLAIDQVAAPDLHTVAKDLVALVLTSLNLGAARGPYQVRIGVSPHTEEFRRPFYLPGSSPYADWHESERILNHVPVDGLLTDEYGIQSFLEAAADFINDAAVQVGDSQRESTNSLMASLTLTE